MKKTDIGIVSGILLIGYTALLAYWMIWGFGRSAGEEFRYNLRPLHTILLYFETGHTAASWINLGGNIAVFVPFGLLIPRVINGKLIHAFVIFLIGVSILETIQLLSRRGSLDIDDVLLNSFGFLAGYAVYRWVGRLFE